MNKKLRKYQEGGTVSENCPGPVQNPELNTANRNEAISSTNYKVAEDSRNCAGCLFYDISPRMNSCTGSKGEVGYCWKNKFVCQAENVCDIHKSGGPIEETSDSIKAQQVSVNELEMQNSPEMLQMPEMQMNPDQYVKQYKMGGQILTKAQDGWSGFPIPEDTESTIQNLGTGNITQNLIEIINGNIEKNIWDKKTFDTNYWNTDLEGNLRPTTMRSFSRREQWNQGDDPLNFNREYFGSFTHPSEGNPYGDFSFMTQTSYPKERSKLGKFFTGQKYNPNKQEFNQEMIFGADAAAAYAESFEQTHVTQDAQIDEDLLIAQNYGSMSPEITLTPKKYGGSFRAQNGIETSLFDLNTDIKEIYPDFDIDKVIEEQAWDDGAYWDQLMNWVEQKAENISYKENKLPGESKTDFKNRLINDASDFLYNYAGLQPFKDQYDTAIGKYKFERNRKGDPTEAGNIAKEKAINYFTAYLDSPLLKTRLENLYPGDPEKQQAVIDAKKEQLSSMYFKEQSPADWEAMMSDPLTSITGGDPGTGTTYRPYENLVTFNQGQMQHIADRDGYIHDLLPGSIVNEISHGLNVNLDSINYKAGKKRLIDDEFYKGYPYSMNELRETPINPNIAMSPIELELAANLKEGANPNDHDRDAHNVKSDIDTIRYELYDAGMYDFNDPNFEFTKDHIEHLRNNPEKFHKSQLMFDMYDDDTILDMMNIFTDTSSMPANISKYGTELTNALYNYGGSLPKFQGNNNSETGDANQIPEGSTSAFPQYHTQSLLPGMYEDNTYNFLSPEINAMLETDNQSSGDFDDKSFSEAFAEYHKLLGPGQEFTWQGKIYSTDMADDGSEPSENNNAINNADSNANADNSNMNDNSDSEEILNNEEVDEFNEQPQFKNKKIKDTFRMDNSSSLAFLESKSSPLFSLIAAIGDTVDSYKSENFIDPGSKEDYEKWSIKNTTDKAGYIDEDGNVISEKDYVEGEVLKGMQERTNLAPDVFGQAVGYDANAKTVDYKGGSKQGNYLESMNPDANYFGFSQDTEGNYMFENKLVTDNQEGTVYSPTSQTRYRSDKLITGYEGDYSDDFIQYDADAQEYIDYSNPDHVIPDQAGWLTPIANQQQNTNNPNQPTGSDDIFARYGGGLPLFQDKGEFSINEHGIIDTSEMEGYDPGDLYDFLAENYGKVDTSKQQQALLTKLQSPTFRDRYAANIYNITGEQLSEDELTERINAQYDFTAAGAPFHTVYPPVSHGPGGFPYWSTTNIDPYTPKHIAAMDYFGTGNMMDRIRGSKGMFFTNKYGDDISELPMPELAQYSFVPGLNKTRQVGWMGDNPWTFHDDVDDTIIHEYAHSYNTEVSPLFAPAGKQYNIPGVYYNDKAGERYQEWLTNLFGEDYFDETKTDFISQWSMQPQEISSMRSENEAALLSSGIWDHNKEKFGEQHLNELLESDFLFPRGHSMKHLQALGYGELRGMNKDLRKQQKEYDLQLTRLNRGDLTDYIDSFIINNEDDEFDRDYVKGAISTDKFNELFNQSQSHLKEKKRYSSYDELLSDYNSGKKRKKEKASEILDLLQGNLKGEIDNIYQPNIDEQEEKFNKQKDKVLPKMEMYFNEIVMDDSDDLTRAKYGGSLPKAQDGIFGIMQDAQNMQILDDHYEGNENKTYFTGNPVIEGLGDLSSFFGTPSYMQGIYHDPKYNPQNINYNPLATIDALNEDMINRFEGPTFNKSGYPQIWDPKLLYNDLIREGGLRGEYGYIPQAVRGTKNDPIHNAILEGDLNMLEYTNNMLLAPKYKQTLKIEVRESLKGDKSFNRLSENEKTQIVEQYVQKILDDRFTSIRNTIWGTRKENDTGTAGTYYYSHDPNNPYHVISNNPNAGVYTDIHENQHAMTMGNRGLTTHAFDTYKNAKWMNPQEFIKLQSQGIIPEDLTYQEAFGTGNYLADPTEMAARRDEVMYWLASKGIYDHHGRIEGVPSKYTPEIDAQIRSIIDSGEAPSFLEEFYGTDKMINMGPKMGDQWNKKVSPEDMLQIWNTIAMEEEIGDDLGIEYGMGKYGKEIPLPKAQMWNSEVDDITTEDLYNSNAQTYDANTDVTGGVYGNQGHSSYNDGTGSNAGNQVFVPEPYIGNVNGTWGVDTSATAITDAISNQALPSGTPYDPDWEGDDLTRDFQMFEDAYGTDNLEILKRNLTGAANFVPDDTTVTTETTDTSPTDDELFNRELTDFTEEEEEQLEKENKRSFKDRIEAGYNKMRRFMDSKGMQVATKTAKNIVNIASPINAALEAREEKRQREQRMDQIRYADNAYQIKDADLTGSQGNYDQFGNFRPSSQTIVMNKGKYGTELTNALYGGLPKAQIGANDNVAIEGDTSGNVRLEGNIDVFNTWADRSASCSGGSCDWSKQDKSGEVFGGIQLETGVQGSPSITSTTTPATTTTNTTTTVDVGESNNFVPEEVTTTTTTPASTTKHYNLNDFVFNIGPRAYAGYVGDSGIGFGLEASAGFKSRDFKNFDPYATTRGSIGYLGDGWGVSGFGDVDLLNKTINPGARVNYGPGYIEGTYDINTGNPNIMAGLSFSFKEGGEMDLDEETINQLIAAGAEIEIL